MKKIYYFFHFISYYILIYFCLEEAKYVSCISYYYWTSLKEYTTYITFTENLKVNEYVSLLCINFFIYTQIKLKILLRLLILLLLLSHILL